MIKKLILILGVVVCLVPAVYSAPPDFDYDYNPYDFEESYDNYWVDALPAGSPKRINIQGVLTKDKAPVTTATEVDFKIFEVLQGGTAKKTFSYTITPDSAGFFNQIINCWDTVNNKMLLSFDRPYYMEIVLKGTSTVLSPRQPMLAAPYAITSQYLAKDAIAYENLTVYDHLVVTPKPTTTMMLPWVGTGGSLIDSSKVSSAIVEGLNAGYEKVGGSFNDFINPWTEKLDTLTSKIDTWQGDVNKLTTNVNTLTSTLPNFATKNSLTDYALKSEISTLGLIDNSVTSQKLADFAVISSKLGDNSVTSSKILDGAISNADIMTGAGINTSKLSGAVSAITGNGLGTLAFKSSITESDITGGINAGSLVGQLTDSQISGIAASKVSGQFTDNQLAGISASKISGQLIDSQISGLSASKISGQLTGGQFADGAVSSSKLAAGAITGAGAFKTFASVSALPASIGGGALAFVNAGALGETGMYMDMAGGSWHKISAFRAPLSDMVGSLSYTQVSGLGSLATKSSLVAADIPALDASKITSGTFTTSRISGLGALAIKSSIDYNSAEIANKPALGTLAYKSSIADADIPSTVARTSSLGSLAYKSSLDTRDIPALDASKITTGTIADARIASVSASKVTGTLPTATIPNLDASKITTGTLPLSKITFANSTENLSDWMEYKAAYTLYFGGFNINIPAQLKFKQGSTFNGNVYPEVTSTSTTTGYYLGSSGLKWRYVYAYKYYGTNTAIASADLNEKHNVSGVAEDGDVMMISGSDQMSVCNVANSTKVAGVYRGTEGGLTMNEELKDGKPIVYTGRYDVKVDTTFGAIEPGDLLISSTNPGYAMKAPANPQAGTIIGKALKAMPAGQKGKLLVLVTLQ
ncbi:MAG: hypothetical protein KKC80_05885 [Candidatus Margulisbacteria bacterium]|nr:hypothetical protein [Candidatus Margulisiibacteriota bacterium]